MDGNHFTRFQNLFFSSGPWELSWAEMIWVELSWVGWKNKLMTQHEAGWKFSITTLTEPLSENNMLNLQAWTQAAAGQSRASMETPTQWAESARDRHLLRRCCCPSWQYFLLLHMLHGPHKPHTASGRASDASNAFNVKISNICFKSKNN